MHRAEQIERDDTLWDPALEAREPDPNAWLGRRIGADYCIIQHLGSGGMGHVFLAEREPSGMRAAAKILPADGARRLGLLFDAETKLLARMQHPNIVRGLAGGELGDGSKYLLMEHATGMDLNQLLNREPLSTPRIVRILRQVASAVDYLHDQRILHRDIKPANIMVDPCACDAVKLIDFGIAVQQGSPEASDNEHLIGTPAHMAPEQVTGGAWTRASDLYSVGALALELLTGRPPYDYPSLNLVLAALQVEKPASPSQRGIQAAGLDALFERALARDPEHRFRTAKAFVDELERVLRARRTGLARMALAALA